MKTWSINGFSHSGITVKNLKSSVDFYTKFLGFTLVKKQTNDTDYIHDIVCIPGLKRLEIAFLKTPNDVLIELLEYVGVETYSGATRSCDYGTGHICLEVTDLEDMFQDLKREGIKFKSDKVVTVTSGYNKGTKAVYMEDPDGYLIELLEK